MMRTVWLAATAMSCTRPVESPTRAPIAQAARDGGVAVIDAKRDALATRWSNIVTVDNCFYFSGPFNGRNELLRGDAAIEIDGEVMRVRLADARFEGTVRDEQVEVARTTTNAWDNGTWIVTERLVGTYRDATLQAQYRYEECDGKLPCPGRCTMTADLIAR